MAQRTVRIFVGGRVQGVGYRAFAAREADRLGLRGWVRNRYDGRVEALVTGEEASVDEFLLAAERGPRIARVEFVHVVDAGPEVIQEAGDATEFTVAPEV